MVKISDRIKEAMQLRGLKQNELADKAGVNTGALSCWLNGKYTPKQKSIYKLAQALDVSELWLLGDENTPMEKYHQVNIGEAIGDEKLSQIFINAETTNDTLEYDVTEEEAYIIDTYRSLDDYGKQTVMAVLEKENERCKDQEEYSIPISDEELQKLPLDQALKFEPYIDDGFLRVARKKK